MSLFAIGDTHLSLGTNKPMDIFRGWQDYVQRLEKNWRAVVSSEDTVIIPGDVSWAMQLGNALADFRFLDELPGRKILMKGNHDYWWTTMRKMQDFLEENGLLSIKILHNNAYRVGDFSICGTRGWFFDATDAQPDKVLLREVQRLKTSIAAGRALGGEPLVFLHYPPVTRTQRCEPILEALHAENIRRCYYAHLHSTAIGTAFQGELEGIHFSLVSSDSLGFCPKLIEKIKS